MDLRTIHFDERDEVFVEPVDGEPEVVGRGGEEVDTTSRIQVL